MNKVLGILATALPVMIVLSLLVLARSMPGYFTNEEYLVGAVFLQALVLALWFYDRAFFPLLMISFLWAGMDVPMAGSWTVGRWAVLGVGAIVGFMRSLRLGRQQYNPFHLVALFCAATALVSSMVSQLPAFSALKALSLFLLFLYGAGGARLVLRDQDRFFRGLLLACEINVYVTTIFYFVVGREIWGNSNALGAIEGVVAAPLLLWGTLAAGGRNSRIRRAVACVGALYLLYFSITRAAFLAAGVSMALLLVGLRRQRLLFQGVVAIFCVAALTAIAAPSRFEDLKTSFTEGVVFKGHPAEGLLGSRRTPWQETADVIRESPYFGSGFGASVSRDNPFGEAGKFSSSADTNREHGSSYLAIMEWMGFLGIVPFAILIFMVMLTIRHVFVYLRRTGNVAHYSVPIMVVLAAGLTHALFEDWLFAVGYYLTTLFWSLAFLLMDLAPRISEHSAVSVHGMTFRISPLTATSQPRTGIPAMSGTPPVRH